jgi:hypothetical protein
LPALRICAHSDCEQAQTTPAGVPPASSYPLGSLGRGGGRSMRSPTVAAQWAAAQMKLSRHAVSIARTTPEWSSPAIVLVHPHPSFWHLYRRVPRSASGAFSQKRRWVRLTGPRHRAQTTRFVGALLHRPCERLAVGEIAMKGPSSCQCVERGDSVGAPVRVHRRRAKAGLSCLVWCAEDELSPSRARSLVDESSAAISPRVQGAKSRLRHSAATAPLKCALLDGVLCRSPWDRPSPGAGATCLRDQKEHSGCRGR